MSTNQQRSYPKNRYGVEDEWGAVVKAQNELLQQLALQEQHEKQLLQKAYQQELNAQKNLQDQEKEQIKKLKEIENDQARTKTQLFEIETKMNLQQNLYQKRGIANENLSYKQNKLNQDLIRQQESIKKETHHLEQIRNQIEQDKIHKFQEKQVKKQDQDQQLNHRQQFHYDQKQQHYHAKLLEQKQAEEQQMRSIQKEIQYKQYYDQLSKGIDSKQQLYISQVAKQIQEKNLENADWVSRHQKEYQQRLIEKQAYERYVRQQNQSATNSTILSQMEFINLVREKQKDQKAKDYQESYNKQEQNKIYNQQLMDQKKANQNEIKQILQYQMELQKGTKLNQMKMSENEKRLNNQYLDAYQNKTQAQVKIPGLYSDYSNTVLKRSAQNILGKPLSSFSTSVNNSPKRTQHDAFEQAENPSYRHDLNNQGSFRRSKSPQEEFDKYSQASKQADNNYNENARKFYGVDSSRGQQTYNSLQLQSNNQMYGQQQNQFSKRNFEFATVSSSRNLLKRDL